MPKAEEAVDPRAEVAQSEIEDWLGSVLDVAAKTVEERLAAEGLTDRDLAQAARRDVDDTAALLGLDRDAVEEARRRNPLWPLRRPIGC